MPNHITNILKISGNQSKIEECLKAISSIQKDEQGNEHHLLIDFQKIVPRPASLDITSGGKVSEAMALIKNDDDYFKSMLEYPWVKHEGLKSVEEIKEHYKRTLTSEEIEEGRKAIHNEKEYGCRDWYDWSCNNWGTKWNAYDQFSSDFGKISFDTAWSTPFPVIQKLAQKYPELDFEVEFADEDIGNNCGAYKFQNGMLVGEYLPKGLDADRFACEIKGMDFLEFTLNNIEYWNAKQVVSNTIVIIELLEEGYEDEIAENLDNNNDKAAIEEVLKIAVDNEHYELAEKLKGMLG